MWTDFTIGICHHSFTMVTDPTLKWWAETNLSCFDLVRCYHNDTQVTHKPNWLLSGLLCIIGWLLSGFRRPHRYVKVRLLHSAVHCLYLALVNEIQSITGPKPTCNKIRLWSWIVIFIYETAHSHLAKSQERNKDNIWHYHGLLPRLWTLFLMTLTILN